MFNHREWLDRARRFVASLASLPGETEVRVHLEPPLTRHEADSLARRLPQGLPTPIHDFVTHGSAGCDCHYWWEPPKRPWPALKEIFTHENFIYGGPVMCDVQRFADMQESRLEWAANFSAGDPEEAKDHDLWTRYTPFAELGNGDMLGLDNTVGGSMPAPVAYLAHEGGSRIICSSFEAFLKHWQVMSYIGPEIWLLNYWIDKASGQIDSAHPKSMLLRRLLVSDAARPAD